MEVLGEKFRQVVYDGAREFLALAEAKSPRMIRIIAHNDTDGITSSAILMQVLKRLNLRYWLSNPKVFDLDEVSKLEKEEWDLAFILDFGLSEEKYHRLEKTGKRIFILDHHIMDFPAEARNITLISAYKCDEKLSASAISYFFGKALSEKNKDLAYIGILGLLGDLQKVPPYILKDAMDEKKVSVRRGPRIFGASTRPLHRALALSDIFIPGISGREEEALEILRQAGIKQMENGRYRTLLDLSEGEMKALCTLIATRGGNGDFIDDIYIFNINGKLYDGRELSSMVNSCGRLGKAELGIEACYGNVQKAEKNYEKYRKEIFASLNWFEKKKGVMASGMDDVGGGTGREAAETGVMAESRVLEACNGKVWLINAKGEVRDTIIGVLISMLSSYYKDKILIGMASSDERIKISIRASNLNAKEFLGKMLDGISEETGGHANAAGGFISKANEITFINRITELAKW